MSDLFNNPAVNNALKAMSPEQIDEYKRFGESLYGSINFEDSTVLNNMPPPMAEAVAYIEEGIKAGLLPEDITEDEVSLLCEAYGEDWYKKYGFEKHEIHEPGLSLVIKKQIDEAVKYKIAEVEEKEKKEEKKKEKKEEKKKKKKEEKEKKEKKKKK